MKKTFILALTVILILPVMCVYAIAATGPYTGGVNHGYGEKSLTGYGDKGGSGSYYGSFDSENNNSRAAEGKDTTDGGVGADSDNTDSGLLGDGTSADRETDTESDRITDTDGMADEMPGGNGRSTVGIVIAILVAVAVVVLIVALVPKGN